MYHLVGGADGGDLAVSKQSFRDHLDLLAERGFRGCSLAELVASPDRTGLVGITFDDAFRAGLPTVADDLVAHGFTATVYVPTNFVGRTATWIRDDRSTNAITSGMFMKPSGSSPSYSNPGSRLIQLGVSSLRESQRWVFHEFATDPRSSTT